MNRKLRFGMIGGGPGSFIGPVHVRAAMFDGRAELVAGAFSSSLEKSKQAGREYYLDDQRVYGSWEEMILKEKDIADDKRLDFVIISTPNYLHFPIAKGFIEAGFHVVCDKPMTMTLQEAKLLEDIVNKSGKVFVLTHTYTGYPMVKQARYMVRDGQLGTVHKVVVEYSQGWLSKLLSGSKPDIGLWRMDPAKAGASCAMGDIGTHAENLCRFITGLEIDSLCADISSFIPGNLLEDDGNILIRFKDGAKGILYASQVSTGEENGLRIRVFGEKLGLEWSQEFPNYLYMLDPSGKRTRLSRGNEDLSAPATQNSRLPSGHPEGYFEAFANLYNETYRLIDNAKSGQKPIDTDIPGVHDGVIGMQFIETVLASASSREKWTKM